KAIKIIKSRGEADTSLKQVSAEERKLKIIEAEKNDKAVAFLDFIKSKFKLEEEEAQDVQEKILQKYSGEYDVFEAVSRNGFDALSGIDLP
ncbi:MAG: RNA-binding protein, partial [Nitrososphaera sp.]